MKTSTLRSVVECQLQLGFPDITTRYFGDFEFTLFPMKSYTARLGLSFGGFEFFGDFRLKFDCGLERNCETFKKIHGKSQDCTSASKHPGQPLTESLQPVIPFKMAPWPEEDLLPVSSPKPHHCWNSLHFFVGKKRKKDKGQYHTNCCLHCSTLRARHHHTWTGHSAAFKAIATSDPKL